MSRLLHAAARGARIEDNLIGGWTSSDFVYLDEKDTTYSYRIHPDDEHLQYGPISTALRDVAITPPVSAGVLGYPVWGHVCEDMKEWVKNPKRNWRMYFEHVEEFHRSLFLLFLAEALADEGM
jgi:hypothetical protein